MKKIIKKIPQSCGVYFFKDKKGKILYIGKANDLKNRIRSHWRQKNQRPGFSLEKIAKIDWLKTESEIEALILEANLVKKEQPPYNVLLRDDKNFFFAAVSNDEFPRIFITHQPFRRSDRRNSAVASPQSEIREYFGPFTDGAALKQTLKFLRKIFPFCTCRRVHSFPCLWSRLKRCPGFCCIKELNQKAASKEKKQYWQNIKNIIKILKGGKKGLIQSLKKQMRSAAKKHDFENASLFRDQIQGLENIFKHQFFGFRIAETFGYPKAEFKKIFELKTMPVRIEAYDVSNISGAAAVGSMVVFENLKPKKSDWRRFKIKTVKKISDVDMLKEILTRRLGHQEWPLPDLIIVDGGVAHLHTAINVLKQFRIKIDIIALAKGLNQVHFLNGQILKLNSLPQNIQNLLKQIRDESHRFAIKYHRLLRSKQLK